MKSALKKCFEVESPPVADKNVLDDLVLKFIKKKHKKNHDKGETSGPKTDAGNGFSKTTQQLAKGDTMPPDTTQPTVSERNNNGGPPDDGEDDSDGDDDEGKRPLPKPHAHRSRLASPCLPTLWMIPVMRYRYSQGCIRAKRIALMETQNRLF